MRLVNVGLRRWLKMWVLDGGEPGPFQLVVISGFLVAER